jgi:hypothetical protein
LHSSNGSVQLQRPGGVLSASSRRLLNRSVSITVFDRQSTFPDFEDGWEENIGHPNLLSSSPAILEDDDVEKLCDERERKKRCERRHSFTGFMAMSETKKPPATDPLAWLPQMQQQQQPPRLEPLEDFSYPSPEPSVSSSRKRGVCGSPLGQDDLIQRSSSSSSRRIFCETSSSDMSFVPSLHSSSEHLQRATTMDVDSDDGDDEESTSAATSVNQSFSSCSSLPHNNNNKSIRHVSQLNEEKTNSPEYILETMSSFDDLKFLVKALRKEKNGTLGMSSFGGCHSWNVAPPIVWSSARRSAFFSWTKCHLGFTVRAVGAALTYLQVPKAKGALILELCAAAVVQQKQRHGNATTSSSFLVEEASLIVWTDTAPPSLSQVDHPYVSLFCVLQFVESLLNLTFI